MTAPWLDPQDFSKAPVAADPRDQLYAFPASLAQKRFWRLDRSDPGNPVYNVAVRFLLRGVLDYDRARKSIQRVVERHEILRTIFRGDEDSLQQVVLPGSSVVLPVDDLRGLETNQREAQIDSISVREAQRRFNLQTGPLIAVRLLRCHDAEHLLLLNAHHSIFDGWSVGIFTAEFAAAYEELSGSSLKSFPGPSLQYADYSVWQQEQLHSSSFVDQAGFWSRQLAGVSPIEVPYDHPQPPRQSHSADIVSEVLSRSLTTDLNFFGQQSGHTFFVTVLSGLVTMLSRYTGPADLTIGTQVAGRHEVEIENLIGCFTNTLILRCDASGNPSFDSLMNRIGEMTVQSLANQEVPYELLVETLQDPPDYSHTAFCRVNFICQTDFVKPLEFSGLSLTAVPSKSQGALYDLNFFLVERPDGWRLSCEYNTDLYDRSTALRMLSEYRTVLQRVVKNPSLTVTQCLAESNPEAPADESFPASIGQQRFWTLHQLSPDTTAYNLCNALSIEGPIDPDLLERSLRMVIDRQAALRTRFATESGTLRQIVAGDVVFRLDIRHLDSEDILADLIQNESSLSFALDQPLQLRAVLLHGGAHKSVLLLTMPHIVADGWSIGVLVRDLETAYEALSLGQQSALLGEPPASYTDFVRLQSQWLLGNEFREQFTYWKDSLAGHDPFTDLPTDFPADPARLRWGGIETSLLPKQLIDQAKAFAAQEETTLYNLFLAGFQLLLSRYSGKQRLLVGSPVANREGQFENTVGLFYNELCLLNDFSGEPSFREVIHRTHEMTWSALSHSAVPFELVRDTVRVPRVAGRNPFFQFYFSFKKAFLRPFTLGMARANPLPTASGTPQFEIQLVIVEREEGIRAELDYDASLYRASTMQLMLADFVAVLEQGLNDPASGSLSVPLQARFGITSDSPSAPYTEPIDCVQPAPSQSRLEEQLTSIWKSVLLLDHVAPDDNFFDLGGHSLSAARLLLAIQRETGRSLPIATLFESPTIRQLSVAMQDEQWTPPWSALVPLQTTGSARPLFLVHHRGINIVSYQKLAARLGQFRPVYAIQPQGLNDNAELLETIEEMAALYIQHIRTVQPAGPYNLCGFSAGGVVAFEMARQLEEVGEATSLLALLDSSMETPVPAALDWLNELLLHFSRHRREYRESGLRTYLRNKVRSLARKWRDNIHSLRSSGASVRDASSYDRTDIVKRAFTKALHAYHPKQYPGSLILFRTEDQGIERSTLDRGWNQVTGVDVHIFKISGDHATVLAEPYVAEQTEKLNRFLLAGDSR